MCEWNPIFTIICLYLNPSTNIHAPCALDPSHFLVRKWQRGTDTFTDGGHQKHLSDVWDQTGQTMPAPQSLSGLFWKLMLREKRELCLMTFFHVMKGLRHGWRGVSSGVSVLASGGLGDHFRLIESIRQYLLISHLPGCSLAQPISRKACWHGWHSLMVTLHTSMNRKIWGHCTATGSVRNFICAVLCSFPRCCFLFCVQT